MNSIESLHNHTTLSDGKLSHRELFDLAESLGISMLAFTDHDAVPPPAILAELETLREHSTKWIIGIELTTNLPHELAPNPGVVHIIGLFINPQNKALLEHCERAQKSRIKRMHQIVEGLQRLGFIITAEDCLAVSGGKSIGRPHIVEALKKRTENNVVMEKIRLEMKAVAEHDSAVKEQYDNMMQRGEQQYPYELFLKDDAFRRVYLDNDYMPDLDLGVSLIRGAGGIAILAHYYTVRHKISMDIVEKLLAEKRIDGVETIFGLREYEMGTKEILDTERQTLRNLAKKYGAVISGGADAHKKEDLELYAGNNWYSGESEGFAAKIIGNEEATREFPSLN